MEKMKKNNILKEYRDQKQEFMSCEEKIKELLKELLDAEEIKYHTINSRIKEESSLEKKCNLKGDKYNKLEDITDIIGIRVITYYSDDIDKVAKIIEDNFDVDKENSIDKRETLDIDRFGYLSLHYIVKLKEDRLKLQEYRNCNHKVEIQIRSILQHAWAEIEHDLGYKNDIETPREIRRDFYRLAGLLETADKEFINIRNQIDQYAEEVKIKIKEEEEVYIDKISLETFANSNRNYRDLISIISKTLKVKFYTDSHLYSSTVQFIMLVGYKTINEVKEDIIKNENKIYNIAKKIVGNKKGKEMPESVLLLYLCYVKLAEKGPEEFSYFLKTNNFFTGDEIQTKNFIDGLINVCENTNN